MYKIVYDKFFDENRTSHLVCTIEGINNESMVDGIIINLTVRKDVGNIKIEKTGA